MAQIFACGDSLCSPMRFPWRTTCLLVALAAGHVQAQNIAQGTITVNSSTTEFRHAYATTSPSRRTGKPETFLILTDKPLATNAIANETERGVVAERDGIHLVELKFDERKTLLSAYFAVAPLKGNVISPSLKLDLDSFTEQGLKGRLYTQREDRAFNSSYAVDVRFNASFAAAEAPQVMGQNVWQTAQGKVLAEFFRASRAGDKALITRLVTPETVAALNGPKGNDVLQFLKRVAEDPKKAEIERLEVVGDKARITMVPRSGIGLVAPEHDFKRIGGVWLIDP